MNKEFSLHQLIQSKRTYNAFKRIGIKHHHGINIPLFSIHTKKSSGIGEFFDLFPLIDWCHKLGFDIIQLLPLNESGNDPSPYNALSSCALHPIYLSLYALPYLDHYPSLLKKIASLRRHLKTQRIPYHAILQEKTLFLKEYIPLIQNQIRDSKKYQDFISRNGWLPTYSLFKVFKNRFGEKHWKDWPDEFFLPSKHDLKLLKHQHESECLFYSILQYLCFSQLEEVKKYAEKKKVYLKGDIPILINPDSADVWAHRELFDLSLAAGQPPTEFNPEGQYWGFPLYNWVALKENNYSWWEQRLQVAESLYHLYRIDHIIGFFRLWAIPPGQDPKTGHYLPHEEGFMKIQGETLLEVVLRATKMLPIGEDLGLITPFIRESLAELGVPGTKILRWEREWEKGGGFIPLSSYPPLSMTSASTHDLDTVALWWKNKPTEAAAYAAFKNWAYTKELPLEKHFEIIRDTHHTSSLFHINLLQEYLALTPHLTWEDPEEERINYPGTVQNKNWTYRYKEPLEVLTKDPKLLKVMAQILK